jgi:hypothetical protein
MKWYNYIGAGLLFVPVSVLSCYMMYRTGALLVFFGLLLLVAYAVGSLYLLVRK